MVGDIPKSTFYPLFDDEELVSLLDLNQGDVYKTSVYAAHSASLMLSGFNTMEKMGDLTIRNETASNYLKALKELISSADKQGDTKVFIPWSLGVSVQDICSYLNDPNSNVSPLLEVFTCDSDNRCKR